MGCVANCWIERKPIEGDFEGRSRPGLRVDVDITSFNLIPYRIHTSSTLNTIPPPTTMFSITRSLTRSFPIAARAIGTSSVQRFPDPKDSGIRSNSKDPNPQRSFQGDEEGIKVRYIIQLHHQSSPPRLTCLSLRPTTSLQPTPLSRAVHLTQTRRASRSSKR